MEEKEQFKVIIERLAGLQDSLDRLDADLATDRKDLQETRIRLASLESQVIELRDQIHKLPDKVEDQVDDAMKPSVAATDSLLEEIKKKTVVTFRPTSFWHKLKPW